MTEIPVKQKVLFICQQNSGRSQLAEALMGMLYGDRFEAYSAGVEPSRVNPFALQVLAQKGVDASALRAKSIEEFKDVEFDYVVTVCDRAKENCPFFPGRHIIHHSFSRALSEGSEQAILDSFVRVRDEIADWLTVRFGAQTN